jgi:hypothetical protein
MNFRPVFIVALLASLLCDFGPGNVSPASLSFLSQIAYNANGTYAPSTLPIWCVNSHTSNSTGAIPASQNVLLAKTTLGATCLRTDANNWDQVEGSLGVYTWTNSDTYFNAICAAAIHPIFVATYNNALYSSGIFTAITGGSNITGYSNFNVAAVNRLIGTNGCTNVIAEEFNEPNLTIWTTSTWNGYTYAGMLGTVSASIKTAQPGVKVSSGGVSPGPGTAANAWVSGLVGAGTTFTNVDYYGSHPYNYNIGTPALTPPCDQILLDVNYISVAGGAISQGAAQVRPIAVTEYGVPWDGLGSSVTQAVLNLQGSCIGEAALDSIIGGFAIFTPYDLIDDGINYTLTDQNSFGLFFNGTATSGSPITGATAYGIKPAGTAYQEVIACSANTTGYTASFNTTLSVETLTFSNGSGKCFAIWTFDATSTKSYSNTIGTFSSVTCKDLLGNSYTNTYSGGVLSMTIRTYTGSTGTGPAICTALN